MPEKKEQLKIAHRAPKIEVQKKPTREILIEARRCAINTLRNLNISLGIECCENCGKKVN